MHTQESSSLCTYPEANKPVHRFPHPLPQPSPVAPQQSLQLHGADVGIRLKEGRKKGRVKVDGRNGYKEAGGKDEVEGEGTGQGEVKAA